VYGTLSAQPLSYSSRDLMTPLSSVQGFFLTNWIGSKGLLSKLRITRKVASLVKSGELQSQIHKVYPIENFREAITEVHKPNNQGKILLKLN
jgi:NADPH:quinone reductase-like Zn-dependent oxidoreductase